MTELFIKLLNMSITASYLIAAVLLIRILAKKIPRKYICLLWVLAGLRLTVPLELESAVSLIPSGHTVTKDIMNDYIPHIDSGISMVDNTVNSVMVTSGATTMASANPMQIYMGILSIAWIVGIAVMALLCAISYVRLDIRLVHAKSLQGRVYLCHEIETPFVLGIFRPRIYLPASIDEEFHHVIAHEEAHIKRLDHVTKPLAYLILMLHWFNPLVWVGFIMYCRDMELACDEKVVKDMTIDERKEYSNALLNCSIKHSALSICPLAFGEIGVKDRIVNVLHFNKPTKAILTFTAAITMVFVICFMTNPSSLATTEIAVDSDMDAAISRGLLSEKDRDIVQAECSAEGHKILKVDEKGAITKVYAIISTRKYGFFDDKFLARSESNAIPVVIYLAKDNGSYRFQKIKYPTGDFSYEKVLKEIFPQNLYQKVLHSEDYSDQLETQMEAYAKAYLDKLGREAEIGRYGDYDFKNLSDYNFPIQVIGFLFEKYSDYDTWLGSNERLIGGVRHVYQVSTDGKSTITYHHYLKNSNKTIEKSIVTISTNEKKARINCLNETTKDSEHYEIALKDDYFYQRQ
ncbi:Methicillin resistance mecR1 protein [uncultured Eubacterium sp.]|nr:Methicillin resistance mecR1 protein [uncultured Eubacterium sp.]